MQSPVTAALVLQRGKSVSQQINKIDTEYVNGDSMPGGQIRQVRGQRVADLNEACVKGTANDA